MKPNNVGARMNGDFQILLKDKKPKCTGLSKKKKKKNRTQKPLKTQTNHSKLP